MEPNLPEPVSKPINFVPIIVGSALIAALMAGGGVYAYEKNQNDTKQADLQSQINALSNKVVTSQTTSTPTPKAAVQVSATPFQQTTPSPTSTQTVDQSAATVGDFYTTYEALSKDTQNMTLKHKLVVGLFAAPTSPKDADMQSLLWSGKSVDRTPGGPELFGSASGSSQMLSYKIISHTVSSRTGTDQEATYHIDETVFNGSQGNTKQLIRHQILQLIRPNPNNQYLISSYTSSDPNSDQGAFYGFIE